MRRMRTTQSWPHMRSGAPGAVTRCDVLFTICPQGSRRRPSARAVTYRHPAVFRLLNDMERISPDLSGGARLWCLLSRMCGWGGGSERCSAVRRHCTADREATSGGCTSSSLPRPLLGDQLERICVSESAA